MVLELIITGCAQSSLKGHDVGVHQPRQVLYQIAAKLVLSVYSACIMVSNYLALLAPE